jgi:sec-independent protein translocase protein TatA
MSAPLFGLFGSFGTQEILLLIVLGVLLFGRKLPDLARSMGKSMTEFKKGMHGIEDQVSEPSGPRGSIEPEPVKAPTRVTPSGAPRFDDAPAPANTTPPKV